MIALDTNIVVRLLTADDPGQHRVAVELMRDNATMLPKTVLLETAWVLGFTYGFDANSVNQALRLLAGYPELHLEDRDAVLVALDWNLRGLELADALHLASSSRADAFATFDRKLANRGAGIDGAVAVHLLRA